MQRKKTFLVVCISILTGVASAQSKAPLPVEKIIFSPVFLPAGKPVFPLFPVKPALPSALPPFRISAVGGPLGAVGGDYYVNHLGFFCKQELAIQKTLRLPVSFRLGTLEYCNKLEGK